MTRATVILVALAALSTATGCTIVVGGACVRADQVTVLVHHPVTVRDNIAQVKP